MGHFCREAQEKAGAGAETGSPMPFLLFYLQRACSIHIPGFAGMCIWSVDPMSSFVVVLFRYLTPA